MRRRGHEDTRRRGHEETRSSAVTETEIRELPPSSDWVWRLSRLTEPAESRRRPALSQTLSKHRLSRCCKHGDSSRPSIRPSSSLLRKRTLKQPNIPVWFTPDGVDAGNPEPGLSCCPRARKVEPAPLNGQTAAAPRNLEEPVWTTEDFYEAVTFQLMELLSKPNLSFQLLTQQRRKDAGR